MNNDLNSIKVPYADFSPTINQVKPSLNIAFNKILDSGKFILGEEVKNFEKVFADYCGTRFASGLSNGTCSLHVVFRALGINPGDEVITVPNSFIATAAAIEQIGAKPVFVDADLDFNIDPKKIEGSITSKTKAIVPVHLTGRPARIEEILSIAKKNNLLVIEDAAQSVGAELNGKRVGSFGDAASFSFHPLKNLHAFGDAGMITSSNFDVISNLNLLKNHGLKDRSTCLKFGLNCRMDEMQASFLAIQLPLLDAWTNERVKLATIYNQELADCVIVPISNANEKHVYQTYVIRADKRDELKQFLNDNLIEALVHYPVPIHLQPAAEHLGYKKGSFPVIEMLSQEILSLPLYPGMPANFQEKVIIKIKEFYGVN